MPGAAQRAPAVLGGDHAIERDATSSVNSWVSRPPDVQHAKPDEHASSSDGTAAHGDLRPSARSIDAEHDVERRRARTRSPSTRDDNSGEMPSIIRSAEHTVHRKFV